jgi:hypothetical protein
MKTFIHSTKNCVLYNIHERLEKGKILNAGCVVANEKREKPEENQKNDSENLQNMMVKNESSRDSDLGFIFSLHKRLKRRKKKEK